MAFNKSNPTDYREIYEESRRTGRSVKGLCEEYGIKTESIYDRKYRHKMMEEELTVTKLIHDHEDETMPSHTFDSPRVLYVEIGAARLTLTYSDMAELAEILGAIKNV